MSKKGIAILIFLAGLFVLIFTQRDKEVDWSPFYFENDTNPFDTKVFHDQLKYWFPKEDYKKVYTSLYEYSYDGHLLDSLDNVIKRNYIYVSTNCQIDDSSLEELLWFVAEGNNAFISADYFSNKILDTLGVEMDFIETSLTELKYDTYTIHTNDSLSFTSKRYYGASYFKDTTSVKILGKIKSIEEEPRTNFVAIPFKKGMFYLHSSPEVFTNYQMLASSNANYVNTVVSYLPKGDPLLIQMNASRSEEKISNSPLRFILSQPALRWAWYLLLLGIGAFMLFNAKRKQRIIPVIEPLKNMTTEFVHSVSTIHYEARDYNGIIQKNIQYFLEHVRSKYFLKTDKLNEDFIEKLALKSGSPKDEVQKLITMLIKLQSKSNGNSNTLSNLNKQLEKFYQK